ncbi:MAG: hypothetical protein JWR01_2643, partial [Subtercola sp.]|nr:hypothetical protein [Subtercola sp.]
HHREVLLSQEPECAGEVGIVLVVGGVLLLELGGRR